MKGELLLGKDKEMIFQAEKSTDGDALNLGRKHIRLQMVQSFGNMGVNV